MRRLTLVRAGFQYPSSSRWVLRNVSFELNESETLRVIGRNGTGKSTLLRVLAGLLPLTEGNLHLAPSTVVAYMDQSAGDMLAADLTIREQLAVVAKRNRQTALNSLVSLAGFGLDLHQRPQSFIGHLSGGERQIIALICTLHAGANVLCLDEFTSALDSRSKLAADHLLLEASRKNGLSLAIVRHQSGTADTDRTVHLPTVSGDEGNVNEE